MYKPEPAEYDAKFSAYINEAPDKDLLSLLASDESIDFYESIPESKYNFKYAEGKWSIKEVLSHIIDGERIFCFRALWFARNNQIPLPGFDEKNVAKFSNASKRSINDLLEEYECVRKSTFYLFKNFNKEMLDRKGEFDKLCASVRALGYLILGHELHHMHVIKEKYLQEKK
jgi:hypothetical protein